MVANGSRQKQKVLERRYTGVQAEIEAKQLPPPESAFPLWGWQTLYSGGATYFAAETIGLYLRLDPTSGKCFTVCAVQLGDMVHTDSLLIHFPDFCERVILWRRGEQVRKVTAPKKQASCRKSCGQKLCDCWTRCRKPLLNLHFQNFRHKKR